MRSLERTKGSAAERRASRGALGPKRALLAALALGIGATHLLTMTLVYDSPKVEGLWLCHVAPFVLGFGCAVGSVPVASIGTLWLAFGFPLWLSEVLAAGGPPAPTPVLVHGGTLVVGLIAARTLGWDREAWWRAYIALLALAGVTRLAPGAEHSNVNLIFEVWPGWEGVFPTVGSFVAFLGLAIPVVFYLLGKILAKIPRRDGAA
ncbi:MAG: hypothetical protein H5U40_12690 [Polyangiaceae bacterium]|nr:hypothetical protein [Polyangiaceae bacterium]